MAASATVTIAGSITGLPIGSVTISGQITSAAAVGEVLPTSLASGDNTFTVPSGTIGVYINVPTANAATVTLKGAGGDTGIAVAPSTSGSSFPMCFPLKASQTSIIVNASAPVTGVTIIYI